MPPRRAAGCLARPGHPLPGSGAPAAGKVGCKKSLNAAGGHSHLSHCYISSSCITSFPKNEYWFSEPRNWAIGSSFGAGRAHQNYPLDLILLCPKWHSNWLFMPPGCGMAHTESSIPTVMTRGISLHHLPSLLADNNLKMGIVCKRHTNDTADSWVFAAFQFQHSQSFLYRF